MKYKNLTIDDDGTVKESGLLVKPKGGKYFIDGEWLSAFTMMAHANKKTENKKPTPINTITTHLLKDNKKSLSELATKSLATKNKQQLATKHAGLANSKSNGLYSVNGLSFPNARNAALAANTTKTTLIKWAKLKKNGCSFIPK